MDLFTLGAAVLIALGLLGADTVIHSGSVEIGVSTPPQMARMDKLSVDGATLESEFEEQLNDIVTTKSIVHPAEIRSSKDVGIGMALAEAAKVESIAFALQSELGYNPDKLHLSLFIDNGQLKGLITGSGHAVGTFRQVLVPDEGESIIHFIRRCALWGGSELAPYSTALYLMIDHQYDGNFQDATALVEHAKGLLPPVPVSPDRALLDNVLGLIALFKNDPHGAQAAFESAAKSDPDNAVVVLNVAFTDVQLDDNRSAADRMQHLVEDNPPKDAVVLGTAYATWGAALLGLHDLDGANKMLERAVKINPDSATALDLWAEAKQEEGDVAAAEALHKKALVAAGTFENYVEVAALYFHLSWKDNEPITRNKFTNPGVVTFH